MSAKGCSSGFNSFFFLNVELFAKIKKTLVSTHSKKASFFKFLLTQELSKIKNLEHPFVDTVKQKTCAKFQLKILNSMILYQAHQSFHIFR